MPPAQRVSGKLSEIDSDYHPETVLPEIDSDYRPGKKPYRVRASTKHVPLPLDVRSLTKHVPLHLTEYQSVADAVQWTIEHRKCPICQLFAAGTSGRTKLDDHMSIHRPRLDKKGNDMLDQILGELPAVFPAWRAAEKRGFLLEPHGHNSTTDLPQAIGDHAVLFGRSHRPFTSLASMHKATQKPNDTFIVNVTDDKVITSIGINNVAIRIVAGRALSRDITNNAAWKNDYPTKGPGAATVLGLVHVPKTLCDQQVLVLAAASGMKPVMLSFVQLLGTIQSISILELLPAVLTFDSKTTTNSFKYRICGHCG